MEQLAGMKEGYRSRDSVYFERSCQRSVLYIARIARFVEPAANVLSVGVCHDKVPATTL